MQCHLYSYMSPHQAFVGPRRQGACSCNEICYNVNVTQVYPAAVDCLLFERYNVNVTQVYPAAVDCLLFERVPFAELNTLWAGCKRTKIGHC
jgi:hypothetical protein